MKEAILAIHEWELWVMFGLWMVIALAVYYAKKQDEKIAVMMDTADEEMKEWIERLR